MENLCEKYPWCEGKIMDRESAARKAAELKEKGRTLVTINGSFDLLHPGHLIVITDAKNMGDVLFVGVNTDASVKEYKGEDRPIVFEDERMAMLAALRHVDYLIPFSEAEIARELLATVRPHIHANSAEYGSPEEWVEWPVMKKLGVEGRSIPRRGNFSTSGLIEKIRRGPVTNDQ